MAEEKGHDGKGHHHDETDPHAWQNPDNVVLYVRNIAAALAKADPAGAAAYQANADAYVKELQTLDAWAKAQFAAIPAGQAQGHHLARCVWLLCRAVPDQLSGAPGRVHRRRTQRQSKWPS